MLQNETTQMVLSAAIAIGAGVAAFKYATNSKVAAAGIGVAAYIGARFAVRGIANMPQLQPGTTAR